MKKLKKLTLKKQTIVNLNDEEMNSFKGGTGMSSNPCWAAISYVTGKIIDYTYDQYMQSKNVDVQADGWISRDYFDGICCISDIKVVC